MYKRILIPTDGSTLSRKAIKHGISLAKAIKAKVTAVTVTVPFEILPITPVMVAATPEQYKKRSANLAAKHLRVVTDMASAAGVICNAVHIENYHPYEAILSAAKKAHCDLIVMASHGRRGIAAIVLGSDTVKVLTHSTIPVLVYR